MRLTPLERQIQSAIVQAFRLKHRIHLMAIDAGAAGMRSEMPNERKGHSGIPTGFPDLLGIIPATGRTLMIEVKRPGSRPRKNQLDFIAWASSQGALAFWADSVDSALSQFEVAA